MSSMVMGFLLLPQLEVLQNQAAQAEKGRPEGGTRGGVWLRSTFLPVPGLVLQCPQVVLLGPRPVAFPLTQVCSLVFLSSGSISLPGPSLGQRGLPFCDGYLSCQLDWI